MAKTPNNRFIRIKNREHFIQVFDLFIKDNTFNSNIGFGGYQCKRRDLAAENLKELQLNGAAY